MSLQRDYQRLGFAALRERHGLLPDEGCGKAIEEKMIAVLELYRAPKCERCSARYDMFRGEQLAA